MTLVAEQTTGDAGARGGIALPKRLPIVVSPANRDDSTAKDARLVNCYMEKLETGDIWVCKRPGLDQYTQPSGGAATGRGVYNWKGDIYSIFGTTLYKATTSKGTVNATNGVYRFSSCLGATHKLQLGDGVKAYNYDDAGGLVNINDVDFPAAFCKGWAYLDGTPYVCKVNASIQGGGINDPVNWDALNTITAQIEPDGGVALSKQLVYVIEFKEWTTEVFYDAANATGSPLSPVQGAKANWGCSSQDSVQDLDGTLLWAGAGKSASVQVLIMNNLKVEPVSTKPVEKLLEGASYATGNVFSWSLKWNGHHFYVLTFKTDNFTLAYDLKDQAWSQWTDVDGNYLPIVSATYDSGHRPILQHESNGKLYYADDAYTTDDDSLITVDIYTPNFDGGTRRKKQLNLMEWIGDQVPGSELQVRFNDFDYDPKKWTNFRTVDLSKERPILTGCGTFRRRAHNFRHKKATKMRLQAVELQLDLGTL